MLADLIRANRSCRRFHQYHVVSSDALKALVDLARLSASAANRQPLRFILSCHPHKNEQIFSCLGWAGYLPDWPGPDTGERPAAYIIVLGDTSISRDFEYDGGIASQSVLLGAREQGLAGCMIANINRKKLGSVLEVSDRYRILLALAIGKPKESVVIESIGPDGDVRYWRDQDGGHHVPKRSLEALILATYDV